MEYGGLMQTFLPFESFRESAKVLDDRRLGKQRVEALQIIKAITGQKRLDGKPYKGWLNHPCSVMWRPYVNALKHYHNIMIAGSHVTVCVITAATTTIGR